MPHKTDIEWCDFASNPLRASVNGQRGWSCVKVSPECAACYAETINKRFGTKLAYNQRDNASVEHFIDEKELRHILTFKPKPPYKNGRERPVVFPFDMTDVFGEWVTDDTLDLMFAAFVWRSDCDWLVLTKRAERL